MSLTIKQQKYIDKNCKKIPIPQIARAINVKESLINEYLKGSQNSELVSKTDIKKETKDFFKEKWKMMIFLAVLVIAVYLNAVNNAFVSDDIATLQKNPAIRGFSNVINNPLYFTSSLIYFITVKIGGVNPLPFRILNILFHFGNVWLIYLLIIVGWSNVLLAFLTAALFAIHPMMVESVTWISGGTYVRYSFFILLMLYFYILSEKKKKYYLYSLAAAALALLSSEKALVLFLVILLYDFTKERLMKKWVYSIPYVLMSGLMFLIHFSRLGSQIIGISQQSYSPVIRGTNPLIQIPVTITYYLQLIFWPDKLTLYHSELAFTPLQFGIRVLVFLGFLGIWGWSWKKNRQIFFWLSFFIISLLPTLTPFGISWIVAERYVYLGTIGILFIASYGLTGLINNKNTKIIGYVLFVICVLALMTRTIVRNMDWRNEDTLWLSMKDISASDPKTHNNLGDMYGRQGNLVKAVEEFKKAIAINSNYGDAYHNLANTYLQMGKSDLALENYKKALKTNPNLWQSYQNIAAIYYQQKNFQQAVFYMEKAVRINPQDDNLLLNLVITYLQVNGVNKAKQLINKILEVNPQNTKAKELLFLINNPPSVTPIKTEIKK